MTNTPQSSDEIAIDWVDLLRCALDGIDLGNEWTARHEHPGTIVISHPECRRLFYATPKEKTIEIATEMIGLDGKLEGKQEGLEIVSVQLSENTSLNVTIWKAIVMGAIEKHYPGIMS